MKKKNKVEVAAQRREYYFKNKKHIQEYKKKYYSIKKNIENKRLKGREYHLKNRTLILAKKKEYRIKNREDINAKRRTEEFKLKQREHIKRKYKMNEQFKIRETLRCRLKKALNYYLDNGKVLKSRNYNIDFEAIVNHLKPFPKDISKYHIDHIRPLCSFNFNNIKEVEQAFKPENHQWLLAFDNQSKGGKYV